MLKALFLAPGRLVAKLFSRDKRRTYRSTRHRPKTGLGTVLLSLFCWLAIAGGVLYAVDKAGLLKQALDAGVEAAQGGENQNEGEPLESPPADPVQPAQEDPVDSGADSIRGQLNSSGDQPTLPTPSANTANTSNPAAGQATETQQWFLVFHSIPKSSKSGREEAARYQKRYRGKGLEVEIIDSDAYHRLKSGYWLVAQGPFDDRASAYAALDMAKQFQSGLMVWRGL